MNRATKIIGFVLVTLFGVYGCAKGPVDATEKNTSPGAKLQRLEEDLPRPRRPATRCGAS